MNLKAVQFPSKNFPRVDLRLNINTQYECNCIVCSAPIKADFGWVQSGVQTLQIVTEKEDVLEVRKHFKEAVGKSDGQFEFMECCKCNGKYVMQFKVNETSNGAFRIVVLGVAQIL